uniref:CSON010710 protein n=1 Tax=Culicoides sonorensis TaxID=179676 RepID=A0A336LQ73_CULSO
MLEWHYQNLVFEENGPFIVKQHASAVLNLLLCGEISCCYPIFVDILEISLCKWFNSAARNGLQEFSQKLLLSTCLNVCGEFMGREPGPFLTFIDNYLRLFLESNTFKMLTEELSLRSSLLTSQKDRSNIYSPLPNLGAIIVRNKQNAPTLIFSKNFPSFLIHSLVTFCHKLSFVSDTNARQQQINSLLFNNDIKTFVNNVIQHLNHKIHTNWFIKTEIMLLLSIINSAKLNRNLIDTRHILGLSLQLLTCLSQEMTISLISLLDDVVFNIDYYDCVTKLVTKEQLKEWRSIYVDSIISSLKPSKLSGKSLTVFEWKTAILVKSWPYHLLAIFLNMLEASPNDQDKLRKVIPEKQIIHTVLPFTDQLEATGMNLVSSTEMLMYLMTAYLGPDSKFLEPDTKQLLKEKADKLRESSITFNLNLKLESRKSFESLYSVFLDTFQGNSYGDEEFSALIMIPLAQKYDIKWRKRVWSEHIAVLRFITCTEQMLFDGIEAYLSPPETDLSLLKCYHQAINNNLLRNGSVPFIIADYHLKRFNERRQSKN